MGNNNINNSILTKEDYTNIINNGYTKEDILEEINLELENKENSYYKVLNKLTKRKHNEERLININGTTSKVVQNSVNAMSLQLQSFYEEANTGKPGKRHSLVSVFSKLKSFNYKDEEIYPVIAYIVLKTTFNCCLNSNTLLSTIAGKLGKEIENEFRVRKIIHSMDEETKIWFRKCSTERFTAKNLESFWKHREAFQINKGQLDPWEDWSRQKRIQVGLKLIELLVYSTGLGKITKIKRRRKEIYTDVYFFNINPQVLEYIEATDETIASLAFDFHPMVTPPLDWSSPRKGGYYLNLKSPVPFIKSIDRKSLNAYNDVHMPNVYKAVNVIQAVPWKINEKILAIANIVSEWHAIPENLGIPSKYPMEKPPYEDTLEWRNKARLWHRAEEARKSKRLLSDSLISEANTYSKYPRIYFPHNIDFRGRIYPLPRFCPQGNDLCKSLLLFAEGKEIGEQGRTWLAFHGANCWGLDKKPIVDRLSWVYDNSELILNCALNPLDNTQWMDADSPWEFLAFCFEWQGVLEYGEKYVCRLPVAFDGSCSGLQHYSAMLRDEVGGSAVNLVPSNDVQDIYKRVADKVNEYLKEDYDKGEVDTIEKDDTGKERLVKSDSSLAKEWLDYGVNRSVCKRPTMTLCYGASKFGFSDQIMDDTVALAVQHRLTAFSDPRQASCYLARLIWRALGEVVVKAREAMDWLQIASGLLAQDRDASGKSVPIFWTTPVGFPVYQKYLKEEVHRVKTIFHKSINIYTQDGHHELMPEGTIITPRVSVPTDMLDPRKQKQGIAPNFVHSMDACHMMMTVLACYEKGVTQFACIHDSFGTLPADAQTLYTTVRDTFCKLYSENDVLQDLHDQVELLLSKKLVEKLPPCPSKGNLDIDKVKDSLYAFS